MSPLYYKLTNPKLTNRNFQLVLGLNQDPNFNPDPSIECTGGLYFCELSQVLYWSWKLGYKHVVDVVIPEDAKVIHFQDKSRADKLLLSNLRPISNIYEYLYPIADMSVKEYIMTQLVENNCIETIKRIHTAHDLRKDVRYFQRINVQTSMDRAAENGHLEVLKFLYNIGATCSTSSMIWAASNGHLDVLKFLHSVGVKCTERAMYYAAMKGHLDVLKFLHSIGVTCDEDAMDYAARNKHIDVLKFLHSIGAKCSTNAIDWAAEKGHLDVIKLLLSIGAKYINAMDLATVTKQLEVLEFLRSIS